MIEFVVVKKQLANSSYSDQVSTSNQIFKAEIRIFFILHYLILLFTWIKFSWSLLFLVLFSLHGNCQMEPMKMSWSKIRKFYFIGACHSLWNMSAPVKQIDAKDTLNEAWSVISVNCILTSVYLSHIFFIKRKQMYWHLHNIFKIYIQFSLYYMYSQARNGAWLKSKIYHPFWYWFTASALVCQNNKKSASCNQQK